MPARRVAKRPLRRTPIGDRRDQVIVHATSSRPRRGGGTEKVFTPIATVAMKVETLGRNQHGFNEVNIGEVPTHRFTTRFRADITAEHFLEFKGSYFEIVDLEDHEGRGLDLILRCQVTGSTSKEASAA